MSTFYSDSFTEASDTDIASHTPNVGGAYSYFAGAALTVKGGLGYAEEAATNLQLVEQAATPGDNAQTLNFDFAPLDGPNNTWVLFYLRKTAGGSACYRAEVHYANGVTIRKIDSGGTETVILGPSAYSMTTLTRYAGSFSIDASGNIDFVINGTHFTPGSPDTTLTSVGKVAWGGRSARWYPASATDGTAAAPVITGPSGTGSVLTGNGSCSTTGSTGLLWWKADASSTASDPGAGSEAGAGWTSQAVSGSGTQTVASFGALTAGTKYVHYLHVDGSSNRSTVADSSSFTVLAAAANAPRTFRPLFLNL